MDAILHVTEGNPAPDDCRAGYFSGHRATRLRYGVFASDISPAQGTVILLPGRNEPIEKYFETIRDLNALGLWVASFDLRGQGGSDRLTSDPRKGHVHRFRDYLRDLDIFIESVVLPDARLPLFILGHSLGGLIALAAAPRLSGTVERMALAAPFLAITGETWPERAIRRGASMASRLGFGTLPFGGEDRGGGSAADNRCTSDAGRLARNRLIAATHPQLHIGAPTARWLHECFTVIDRVSAQAFLTEITIPTLILAPMRDGVVPYGAQEELSRNFRAGQLVTISGARHEIFQERDAYRAQALAALAAFMPGTGATMAMLAADG